MFLNELEGVVTDDCACDWKTVHASMREAVLLAGTVCVEFSIRSGFNLLASVVSISFLFDHSLSFVCFVVNDLLIECKLNINISIYKLLTNINL